MGATVVSLNLLDRSNLSKELDLVSELFHRVNRVLPDSQQLLTVQPTCKARDAISKMLDHGYSQVPVVANGKVLGVFSFRSFAKDAAFAKLTTLTQQQFASGDLPVTEYLEKFEFANVTAEMTNVFAAMDRDNGILLGQPDNLIGVLTPMDFLRYLYRIASPFVLLSEIELALRTLIRVALQPDQIEAVARRALNRLYQSRPDQLPLVLEDMTFDEYRTLLSHGDSWPSFAPVFGPVRTRVQGKLGEIRAIRNDVFHFRREITQADRDTLLAHRDWFLTKVQEAQSRDDHGDEP